MQEDGEEEEEEPSEKGSDTGRLLEEFDWEWACQELCDSTTTAQVNESLQNVRPAIDQKVT